MLQTINQTMSSLEIAKITGKQHKHVIRDIEVLNDVYQKITQPKIGLSKYKDSTGRKLKCYELTKMQTFDLMTGYNTELRIKVNRRWAELESEKEQNRFKIPQTLPEALRLAAEQTEKAMMLEAKLENQKPLINFAEALQVSEHNILIGELAKILKQNDIEIGQNRLFAWMRKNGYLMKSNEQRNLPTQKALQLKLFVVKTRTINNADGSVRVTKTTKVTPKGQKYFINKLLKINIE